MVVVVSDVLQTEEDSEGYRFDLSVCEREPQGVVISAGINRSDRNSRFHVCSTALI